MATGILVPIDGTYLRAILIVLGVIAIFVGLAGIVAELIVARRRNSLPDIGDTSASPNATVIRAGRDLVIRGGDGGLRGAGGSVMIRGGDGMASEPGAPEPAAVQKARHAFELATAELGAFNRRWAGTVFRSKDHERRLLVDAVERTRLAHLEAVQGHERQAMAGPTDVVQNMSEVVIRGENLVSKIHGLPVETSSKVWAAIDVAVADYLNDCQTTISRDWPKLRLTLRDRLAAPTRQDLQPQLAMRQVWVTADDGTKSGTFLVGQGDDYIERITRAVLTLREAIDAFG